jgi:hypothetical protein
MNSYREPEPLTIQPATSARRCFSRRGLLISLLNRLSWCGFLAASSRASVADEKPKAFSNPAKYLTLHDVTAAIARRQRVARDPGERNSPRVGIFWYIPKPGRAPELVASYVALQQGKAYGMCIDGPEDHVSYWLAIKRILGAPLDDSDPKRLAAWPGSFQNGNEAFRGSSQQTVACAPIHSGDSGLFSSAEGFNRFHP